jgi:hypothetical protein
LSRTSRWRRALAVHQWLLKHPRFHLHFTPTSSSWMNLVERWFAELTNRKLRRSAHRSVTELETDIRKWINEWNKSPKPFVWTKSAEEILETLAATSRTPCTRPPGRTATQHRISRLVMIMPARRALVARMASSIPAARPILVSATS